MAGFKPFEMGGALTADALNAAFRQSFYDMNAPVIVKCQHCGQWGAVRCECLKCGAPIDPPKEEYQRRPYRDLEVRLGGTTTDFTDYSTS